MTQLKNTIYFLERKTGFYFDESFYSLGTNLVLVECSKKQNETTYFISRRLNLEY